MKKLKLKIHFNIGTVVFGAIFIYIIITLIMYALETRVETYQVLSGPLSGNSTFTALILRNESVVKSSTGGYVNFFIDNSSKVSRSELICAVTDEEQPYTDAEISDNGFENLRALASAASKRFSPNEFEKIYDLRYSISNILWDSDAVDASSGNFYTSSEDGIVSTLTDGFESFNEDELTEDLGFNSRYMCSRLKDHDTVRTGDNLFRLVSGEEWYIYFTLTNDQLVRLVSLTDSDIKVKFLTDNNYETGTLKFLEADGQKYGKIVFDSGLIRYVDDRFIDIEIMNNARTGLRIPLTSIVSKEFYIIPESFLTSSGDGSLKEGFLKEVVNDDGSKSAEFTAVTLYEMREGDDEDGGAVYYVDKSAFEEGDVLLAADSDLKYTIGATDTLFGVYSVNRGYAVFRKINIIDKDNEYCIVEEGTDYGISLYDYIVKDGGSVKENQIVQ